MRRSSRRTCPPRALRGLREHLLKQRLRHELAARARHKEAARLRQLHAAAVQLAIAPIGAVEGAAALGKGGRVADDKAELSALLAVLPHEIEHIGADGLDTVGHAVARSVPAHHGKGRLRNVHGLHPRRAVQCRVDGEAARMAAQIQHRPPGGIWPQMAAVFLLVEEVAGLLAVFDVHGHEGVVLTDDELRWDRAVDAALALLHALLFAHGKVVALINALRPEHLGQNGENIIPHALHTERDDLERQTVAEFVHRQDQAGHPARRK